MIVYDHRGAGLSEPKVCPEVAAEVDRSREDQTTRERQEAWDDQARACVASLRANGIEPLAFTTHNNVLDLRDLQRVLGYERWDLYGVSYGGWLAQEVMREDPGLAPRRRARLFGHPRTHHAGGKRSLAYQRSLEHLFASCADR